MKGTIAILGCLLAAYAAPLFANEVPLILEETIQMPVATPYWDVAPTWGSEYYWVSHKSINDSMSQLSWGVNSSDEYDTLDMVGYPYGQLSLFLNDVSHLICLVSARTNYAARPGEPFSAFSVVSGFVLDVEDEPFEQESWISRSQSSMFFSGENVTYYTIGALALSSIRVFPSPPDNGGQWQGLLSRGESTSWSNGHSSSTENRSWGAVFDNGVDSSDYSLPYGLNSFFIVSDWADFHYVAIHGYQNRDPGGPYNNSTGVFSVGADNTFIELARLANMSPLAITAYPGTGSPLVAFDAGEDIVGWLNGAGQIWELAEPYSWLFAGYVLIGTGTEQFLGLDAVNRELDVIIAESGQIWGQTTPLDSGYAEMKIIGRYHNETRRLVVRYGSELRIYRFGEPIYTGADDSRPELPNELTLSAYPNPFNPTTMIAFELPKAGRAKLVIYDLNGRLVQTLLDEQTSGGQHEFGFDGAALPSGIYFARLSAGELTRTHKLVLMK